MRGVVREGFDLVARHSVGLALGSLALEKETGSSRAGLFYQPGVPSPAISTTVGRRFDKIGLDSFEGENGTTSAWDPGLARRRCIINLELTGDLPEPGSRDFGPDIYLRCVC